MLEYISVYDTNISKVVNVHLMLIYDCKQDVGIDSVLAGEIKIF